MFITSISITIDSINERFPCTQRSAQENFHAATISRLAMNVKRKDILKILQPTDKRSLYTKILTQRCASTSRDDNATFSAKCR